MTKWKGHSFTTTIITCHRISHPDEPCIFSPCRDRNMTFNLPGLPWYPHWQKEAQLMSRIVYRDSARITLRVCLVMTEVNFSENTSWKWLSFFRCLVEEWKEFLKRHLLKIKNIMFSWNFWVFKIAIVSMYWLEQWYEARSSDNCEGKWLPSKNGEGHFPSFGGRCSLKNMFWQPNSRN